MKKSLSLRTIFLCGKAAAIILTFFAVRSFSLRCTDGFTILGVSSSRPFDPRYETRRPTPEEQLQIDSAFDQTYRYIGRGGQSFIFLSQDEKYVVKLLSQHAFEVPLWLKYFPLPWVLDSYKKKKTLQREDKIYRDFTSYKIALEELQEETGLLFVHLNKSQHLHKKLTLIDKLKISHEIDLDQMGFVVQKKADLVYDRITSLMQQGKIEEAKRNIDAVLTLITTRYQKGYHDRDPNIRTNCGFLGNKAIKIDVGRLMHIEEEKSNQEMIEEVFKICAPFEIWLKEKFPSLALYLQDQLTKLEERISSNPQTSL